MINTSHVKPNGKVDMWFRGPDEPKMPDPPKQLGGHVVASDVARFHNEFSDYEIEKAAYDKWVEDGSKPEKVEMWANDAMRAVQVDDRYSLDEPTSEPEPVPEPEPEPAPAVVTAEPVKPAPADEAVGKSAEPAAPAAPPTGPQV